jgi:hypothetical protein
MQSEEGKTPSRPFLPPIQGDSNSSSVPVHSIFQITFKDSFIERYCPARQIWLKVVSFDRSLLKGEAQRFSANFARPPIL